MKFAFVLIVFKFEYLIFRDEYRLYIALVQIACNVITTMHLNI